MSRNNFWGRRSPERGFSAALAICGEVIWKAMKMTGLDRLHPKRSLALVVIASLATVVVMQHHEIAQLKQYTRHQSELLVSQQELATRAASHLELVRRYEIPYHYLEILSDAAARHGLDLEFMVGLMQVESGFNPNAQSDKAAYGLMQMRFPTALEIDPGLQSYWQLFDPERNIRLGTAYFKQLLDRYDGDYRIASLAYNRGPTRLDDQILAEIELSDSYYRKIRAAGAID